MAEKAKRLVLMGKGGPWELQEFDIPHPGPNQILVKVMAATICNQTDLNTIKGLHPAHDHQLFGMLPHHLRMRYGDLSKDPLADCYRAPHPFEPYPTTMGHEAMGIVVEVGPRDGETYPYGVQDSQGIVNLEKGTDGIDDSDFKVGDRVTIMGAMGSFGEYAICNIGTAAHVPDGVMDEVAAYVEMISFCNLMPRETLKYGQSVAILGSGVVGSLCTMFARKLYNAGMIIAVDPQPFKRERALGYGADYAIDPNEVNPIDFIMEKTHGAGVDVCIECIGVPESVRIIPYIMRQGGSVCQIGAGCVPAYIDWSYIHFKGLNVISTNTVYNRYGITKGLRTGTSVLLDPRVKKDLESIITQRIPLTVEATNEIFRKIDQGNEVLKACYLPWKKDW